MTKNKVITVMDREITIMEVNKQDYISLTDMVRKLENGSDLIGNWLRNKNTIEFLAIWEKINNPDFNYPEFEVIKMEAGLNRFTLSSKKWIEKTNAIGLLAKTGRFGSGTFAHKDIAFEFGSWISAEFRLYLIKEFQRLKDDENKTKSLDWNLHRTLSKINYQIHIDAVKETLVPPVISPQQEGYIYASEADLLNVALFGKTAAEWRKENPDKKGNLRDEATLEQLVVLTNLESINAVFLRQELSQSERLKKLNEIAISQMQSLISNKSLKRLN